MAQFHSRTGADLDPKQATGLNLLSRVMQGQVHEWFLGNTWRTVRAQGAGRAVGYIKRGYWHPPLMILAQLAAAVALRDAGSRIAWIGRNCWPTLQVLSAIFGGVENAGRRSLFLDPLTDAERFWGIGQALRCAGIAAVVADGSGMNQIVSRRLQLAAESGRAVGLLARPPWEIQSPSFAAARWEVRARAQQDIGPGWEIKQISCRGQRREQDAPLTWIAEWSYQVFRGTGALHFSPGVGCGTAATREGPARPVAGKTA